MRTFMSKAAKFVYMLTGCIDNNDNQERLRIPFYAETL